jgi:GNAT superfamily N-acetyltransferase
MSQFIVLKQRNDVEPWLTHVINASDSNTNELGFLPKIVFSTHAMRGNLYVLKSGTRYAGHLLFTSSHPRLKVTQMYVDAEFRGYGGGRKLLETLIAEHPSFAEIRARVAEDMDEANAFWERNHFRVHASMDGGQSTGRKISVRVRALDLPQLFPADPIQTLEGAIGSEFSSPSYLLDLNVLFDAGIRRERQPAFSGLIASERQGMCKLFISDEIANELHRSAQQGKVDRMMDFVATFETLSVGKDRDLEQAVSKLVFPNGIKDQNSWSDQGRSLDSLVSEYLQLFINQRTSQVQAMERLAAIADSTKAKLSSSYTRESLHRR